MAPFQTLLTPLARWKISYRTNLSIFPQKRQWLSGRAQRPSLWFVYSHTKSNIFWWNFSPPKSQGYGDVFHSKEIFKLSAIPCTPSGSAPFPCSWGHLQSCPPPTRPCTTRPPGRNMRQAPRWKCRLWRNRRRGWSLPWGCYQFAGQGRFPSSRSRVSSDTRCAETKSICELQVV